MSSTIGSKLKYSLSIHDLRISETENTIKKIEYILNLFNGPVTLHLIFDEPLQEKTILFDFLMDNIKNNKIEIVFHGLTHKCSKNVSKLFSFYHKYQAEYLDDSELLRVNSEKMFHDASMKLGQNMGVCPPCWIAHKNNLAFFGSLKPLYIETLLHVSYMNKKIFSPVISLGSPNNAELFFLKFIGKILLILSFLFRMQRIRVAIHECDIAKSDSIEFFEKIISSLQKRSFQSVLLNELS